VLSDLSRVLDATLHLDRVELAVLLRLVVEAARSLCGSRFGAIWVLDETRTNLSEFIRVGDRSGGGDGFGEAIGQTQSDGPPTAGTFGEPFPLRLAQLGHMSTIMASSPAHEGVTSVLRSPIDVHGQFSGSLDLAVKEESLDFNAEDDLVLRVLATAAGIAVENARRREETEGTL
jgi:GAF domain-containing protein